jgi:hypothetical protein
MTHSSRRLAGRAALASGLVIAATACGELVTGSYGEQLSVVVSPSTLPVGGRAQVVVDRYAFGQDRATPVPAEAVRLSSGDVRVVRLEQGVAVGVAPGQAFVRAAVGGRSDSVLVTVR